MSSSYYFGNLAFDDQVAADEEKRRTDAEGARMAEQMRLLYGLPIPLAPFEVTATPYDTNNPYDNQLRLGDVPTNPFNYENPYQGPAPTPPPVSLGAPELMLPVTTDPTVIGALDPVTGLPIRHEPDPVPLTRKDIHPTDPMGPNNPTIYPPGGVLGSGVDVGIPGLVSVGGLLGAGGGLLGLGGDMGGLFGGGGGSGGGGVSGPPSQGNPAPVIPPVNPFPSQPAQQNDTLTAPLPTGSGGLTAITNQQQNQPPVTVPPIIPTIGGGGQNNENTPPVTIPVTPATPTTPTTPTVPTVPIVPTVPSGGGSTPTTPTTPVPTTLPLPLDRNYYREGSQTNQDNSSLLPGILQNYAANSGGFGQADMNNYAGLLASLGLTNAQLTGFANQQTASGNTALRTGNVQDAQNLGGQALGVLQQLNPNMYGALNRTNTAAGTTGQPSDIQTMLEQQAREGLALGGQLSPEDIRRSQQAAREAWSARGLVNSTGAVADEVLNRDALARQRLAERQALASAVDQQGFSQRQQGFGNQIQNSLLQMQGAFNPFQTITSANTTNQGSNQQLFSQGAGFSSGAFGNQNVNQLVNPFSPYAQDVFNSNFNAGNARYISAGNNAAAMAGARDAATGDIANSFLRMIGQIYGGS